MPKSVPLRVKIEGAEGKTVKQKGTEIQAESDGSYVIELHDRHRPEPRMGGPGADNLRRVLRHDTERTTSRISSPATSRKS